WSEARELDWFHLAHEPHEGVRRFVRDCNRVYRAHSALHARDCEPEGFAWAVVDDALASVFAWVRHAPAAPPVAVIANFTTQAH
ncbi:1,4-alpha-glucan branching protein GlgB, partial [Enterococcus faecalis]